MTVTARAALVALLVVWPGTLAGAATLEVDAVAVTHPHHDHDAGRYRGRSWPCGEGVEVFDRTIEFRSSRASPTSPDDLGGVEPRLAGRDNVVRLSGCRWDPELPRSGSQVVVFRPSPLVRRPTGAGQ